MVTPQIRHRITRDEYHQMLDGGVFAAAAKLEPHASVVARLTRRFVRAFGDEACVRPQLPIALGNVSEPEPDLAVVRRDARGYVDRHPAAEGIVESWLIDLLDDVVLVCREPSAAGYGRESIVRRGETIAPLHFEHVRLAIAELLPPAL